MAHPRRIGAGCELGEGGAEGEVALRLAYVLTDLRAEGFGGGEADFSAEAVEEGELEGGVFGERNGFEVEEVGLYGEGVDAEGGAVAGVGDTVEGAGGGALADAEGGDVDAVGGEEVGVGGEVDGGDGVAGAVAATGCGGAADGEGTAQEGASLGHVAFGDEISDAGGGYRRAAQDAGLVGADGEVEVAAEVGEAIDICRCGVAEAEVFAFVNFDGVEGVAEVVGGEGAGRLGGEIGREWDDKGGVEAGGGEELELLREWGDEADGDFGAEDADGVGVEGDGDGLYVLSGRDAEFAGAGDDVVDDEAVAAVHAVEVADGEDGGGGVGGEVVEGAEDFHRATFLFDMMVSRRLAGVPKGLGCPGRL